MKRRNVNLEKGKLVYLEKAQLVVRISEMYYLEDMPMDRGQNEGWYIEGTVTADHSNSGRENEYLRSISNKAISHIVIATKPKLVLQRIVH